MPRGILNKLLKTDYGWVTSEELRDNLLGRNLPPPVTDTVIEGGLQSFQAEMGKVIFQLPAREENIPLDKNKIFQDEQEDRDILLGYNKYKNTIVNDIANVYEYVTPTIDSQNVSSEDYLSQNFGVTQQNSLIGVSYPFTAIDYPRDSNFDTPLGNFGSERLEFLINEKINQAVLNETTNRINTSALDIVAGGELIDRNYDITIPATILGRGADLISRMTGVEIPVSTIPKGAIGWQEYNNPRSTKGQIKNKVNNLLAKLGVTTATNLTTEGRMNELLKRTGSGQKNSVFTHLRLNEYAPNYRSPRFFGLLGERETNSRYYIGNEDSTNRGYGMMTMFKAEDFQNASASDTVLGETVETIVRPSEDFVWGGEEVNFPEQTILEKTKDLTRDFSETDVFIDQTKKFFKDKMSDKFVSRGNAIQNNSGEYARVWLKSPEGTEESQLRLGYSYQNAIKKSGLYIRDPKKAGFSTEGGKESLSVLQSNGMVKYYPYLEESFTTYKKYMLSLENLAWVDKLADLPMQEIGPGDLLTGNKGRIMWFAPYDLSFDENITANWTETSFIGRGESLYTYNNTKRTGQLKFKIVVDHPRVINEYRGRQDKEIEKFLAGITTPQEFLDLIENNTRLNTGTKKELEKKLNSIVRQSTKQTTETKDFVIYFENDSTEVPPVTYETDKNKEYIDLVNNTGNSEIGKFLSKKEGQYQITLKGYASKSASESSNQKISEDRISSVENLLKQYYPKNKKFISEGLGESQAVAPENADADNETAIVDRRVEVSIVYKEGGTTPKQDELKSVLQRDLEIVSDKFINETTYFDIIKDDYPTYFDNISSKIKYFHPGFHSTTPEGLNTRLTFLQQCMRQASSVYSGEGNRKPDNLAFGRPPVCILRIGDFIHTKVIIESLNISYANGSNIQWDLNPEGVGVQPMTADVSLTISIIGGQSLQGPINRLQNAMSYNFYANTELYDPRADSIKLNNGKGQIENGYKLGEDRKKEGIDISESLKEELPIDQDATRLKQEEVEAEESKKLGDININEGKDDNSEPTFTIVSLNEVPEPTEPSKLVDKSGENKIKVVITDLDNNNEIFNGLQTESTWEIPLSAIGKEKYNNASKMNDVRIEIIEVDKQISGTTKKRKIKGLERKKEQLEKKLNNLIEENTIAFKISASFSRGEEINPKNKSYTYKWDDQLWYLQ